ncbi:MAG: hypothetical protein HUJ61_01695, partial [Bacilli bacterium]|nr:hypothetical protein [Bacilli bacterium]
MKKRSIFAIAISIGVFCFSLITPTLAKYETNLSLVKGEVYVPNFISQDSFVKFLDVFDQYFKNDENNKIINELNENKVIHSEIEKDGILSDLNVKIKNAELGNDYLYSVELIEKKHTNTPSYNSLFRFWYRKTNINIDSFTYKIIFSPILDGINYLNDMDDG